MQRVRKAIWKEKDMDKTKDPDGKLKKSKVRLHCEMDKKEGIMIFWLTKNLTEEMV